MGIYPNDVLVEQDDRDCWKAKNQEVILTISQFIHTLNSILVKHAY